MGALSVTGQPKYRQNFGPLVPGAKFMPFGDLEAARAAITDKTCALIIEPIQAEGGINLPPPGYLQELRKLCTERGTVLIFDEVQTGVGRTGTFYAFEKEGVVPDVITLAKGLAGGVPMGAMVANEEVSKRVRARHPRFDLRGQSAGVGRGAVPAVGHRRSQAAGAVPGDGGASWLGAAAPGGASRGPRPVAARGRGLLQGLVMDGDAAPVIAKAREKGLLLTVAGGNVVRFAPALVVTRDEIDEAVAMLDATWPKSVEMQARIKS